MPNVLKMAMQINHARSLLRADFQRPISFQHTSQSAKTIIKGINHENNINDSCKFSIVIKLKVSTTMYESLQKYKIISKSITLQTYFSNICVFQFATTFDPYNLHIQILESF